MVHTPRRLFLAIGALVVIWIVTFWLYEPSPPPVTYGDRPASLTETDVQAEHARSHAPPAPAQTRLAADIRTPAPLPATAPKPRPPAPQPAVDAAKADEGSLVAVPEHNVMEYTVAKGDVSWEAIAQRLYGDRRRAADLAGENPLVDPHRLIPGRTVVRVPLTAPVRQAEVAKAPPSQAPPAQPPAETPRPAAPAVAAATERTYTIASGDTLSGIAKRFLGQSSQWSAIFQANKDKIPDPDHLPLGVAIRIPAPAGD